MEEIPRPMIREIQPCNRSFVVTKIRQIHPGIVFLFVEREKLKFKKM